MKRLSARLKITNKKAILYCLLPALLIACFPEDKYSIKGKFVYMTGWNEANGNFEVPVSHADPTTFETIENNSHQLFGKDKDHVFFETTIIDNADPNTFKAIGNSYYVDNDSVYFFGFFNNKNDCEVWGVKPDQIRLFETYPWAHDNSHVIFGQTVSELINPERLQIVNRNWARTEDKIFYKGYLVDSVDIPTFKIISKEKAQDKNYIYYQGAVYLKRTD